MAQNNNQGNNQDRDNRGGTSNRGFASMDEDKQRRIASEGGKAAHASGNAHEWDSKEARDAGSKGGKASHQSDSNAGDENDDQSDMRND